MSIYSIRYCSKQSVYNNSFCPHNEPMKILSLLFFIEVWYMWYTLLFSCVQHDLTFETLQNGHHNKSSYHLSAYKVNAILLTVFSMLYFSSPWLTYYATGCLHLFIPFTYSTPHLPPILNCFSPLATTRMFSVSKSLGFVSVSESTCKWNCVVFIFLCQT